MESNPTPSRWFTAPEVAKLFHVSDDKVRSLIASGELRAVNLASRAGRRPRWRISAADLATFEARRAAVPARPVPKRRRKPNRVVEYF
jgi:excisionase family DNA binding protein